MKKLFIISIVSVFLLAPAFVSAKTVAEQIAEIQAQIAAFQQQLANLQNGVTVASTTQQFGVCFAANKKACETRMGVSPNEQEWQHTANYWSNIYLPCFNEAYAACGGNGTSTANTVILAPTAALTQSATTTTSDGTPAGAQPFTVSWSSTNATSCTVQKTAPDGTLQNPWANGTSDSKVAGPYQIGVHHWWIDCNGAGGAAHADMYHTVTGGQTTGTGTGTGHIRATMNGIPWGGQINVIYLLCSNNVCSNGGVLKNTMVTVPADYPPGPVPANATLELGGGGPAGATFKGIAITGTNPDGTSPVCTSNMLGLGACGTITAGGDVTFTYVFTGTSGGTVVNNNCCYLGRWICVSGDDFFKMVTNTCTAALDCSVKRVCK